MKKHIPNIITSMNLLTGSLGIICAFEANLVLASWMIILAAIFDFFDGFSARVLNAKSDFGKELDSLADMISFGLLPGIILYQLLSNHPDLIIYYTAGINLYALIALLIPLFSALRLAKFNTDSTQINSFKGLPTPASAIVIASIPLMLSQNLILFPTVSQNIASFIMSWVFLSVLIIVLSFLMICNLPLISLKFKRVGFAENKFQYLLIFISVILLLLLQFWAIPLILVLYISISLLSQS